MKQKLLDFIFSFFAHIAFYSKGYSLIGAYEPKQPKQLLKITILIKSESYNIIIFLQRLFVRGNQIGGDFE